MIGKPERQVRKASHCGSTEITRRAHSISACSCHVYMGVLLHTHLVRGESHIQHNAKREVATLATSWARLVEKIESEREK